MFKYPNSLPKLIPVVSLAMLCLSLAHMEATIIDEKHPVVIYSSERFCIVQVPDVPIDGQDLEYILSELSHTSSESDPFAAAEIYNPEDPDYHQTCEVKSCKGDVFSSCFQCSILLCWKHFEDDTLSCQDGHRTVQSSVLSKEKQEERRPEDFFVEGSQAEGDRKKSQRR
ncbi:unnamed protein product [Acanthoscelides obtectus]|uniref:Uncharacterized protein n=1 Tax=Acanthoscelides obtectus TaxID=200917 RepID=A0A9P0NUH0_ACAOB|nr:unnamed protein product [Acanthoscelides obtectus]CAK1662048.1 hypothetical protein AOBTE_LOCUS22947 [Acanthoscelides obtectus]